MINLKEWKVNNLVIELRFAPPLHFFDKREELIKNLYMTFPVMNTQDANSIVMHTENNPGISLNIFPNRLTLVFEQFHDASILCEDLCSKLYSILQILDIPTLQRFGMRINMLKMADPKTTDAILNKFLNNKFEDLNLTNSSYVLNFTNKEDFNIRVALNKGISQNFQIIMNQPNEQSYFGVTVDIDVSKEIVDAKEIESLIDCTLKEYEKCQLAID